MAETNQLLANQILSKSNNLSATYRHCKEVNAGRTTWQCSCRWLGCPGGQITTGRPPDRETASTWHHPTCLETAAKTPSINTARQLRVLLQPVFLTRVTLVESGPPPSLLPSSFSRWMASTAFIRHLFKNRTLPSVLQHCWLGIRKSIWPVKNNNTGVDVVVCLQQGANDLHMVQMMPLPPHHLLLHQNPEWRLGEEKNEEEQTTAWKYIWSALLHRATTNNGLPYSIGRPSKAT